MQMYVFAGSNSIDGLDACSSICITRNDQEEKKNQHSADELYSNYNLA